MASSSPSRSSSPKYDVFLSFHGEDTRKGFTDHLYHTLKDYKFNVFIDETELEKRKIIPNEVEQAIEESRVCIIVFSRRYLKSRSCGQELVKIMDCKRTLGLLVFPIYYGVEPSDVRLQEEVLPSDFPTFNFNIWLWKMALVQAAALSAYVLNKDGYEGEFIGKVIEDISRELMIADLDVAIHQVGIEFRMREISYCLDVGGSEDVRMIGIWGMGGIGKTELAKTIFIKYYDLFDGRSFLQNVREKKLIDLQEQLLFDILKPVNIEVSNVDEGTKEIEKRLCHLRVLIVLDDIDHVDQLDALAVKRDSFGVGSRVIITTRDEHLLKILRVDEIYSVQTLYKEESLELLSWHAFRNHCPDEEHLQLSREVVHVYRGLPLALQIVGCSVFTKSKAEWTSALDILKRQPPVEIHKKLKRSYDGLTDDDVRAIFLDISCFFSGRDKDVVMAILDGCNLYSEIGIRELHERCLVSVNNKGNLKMHKLIKDMGRQIARTESPDNPGERSRLWHPEDAKYVLTTKSGTEVIEGLALDLQEPDEPSFSTEAFTNMLGLRLLKLKGVKLTGSFKHLSNELRWLSWHGFPLKVIPEDFDQPNLVALELRYSKLIRVWEDSNVLLEKLKIVNLSDSQDLRILPDFSRLPNLEKLILKGCTSLSEVHPSIGDLKRLTFVNLTGCRKLKNFPPDFYNSKCIETLLLNDCSSFENLAEGLGDMVSLATLLADNTAIREIPSSVVKLKNLRSLALCSVEGSQTTNLLPPSLHGLNSLRGLFLRKCNLADEDIPKDLGSLYSLEKLELEGNRFSSLPSLSSLSKLKMLDLLACINMHTIPDLPTSMEILVAMGCTELKAMPDFSEMSNMRELYVSDSPKLTDIPGLDKSLYSMTRIHMEGCTNLTADFRKNIMQGWTSCGYGGILLNGIYGIPEWFELVNEHNVVDFEVPQTVGHNLKGVTLCCIYSSDKPKPGDGICITVTNFTKGTALNAWIGLTSVRPYSDPEYHNLWQGQLSNDVLCLQGGDKVGISVGLVGCFASVKKTGINLVWDKSMKENVHGLRPYLYKTYLDSFSGPGDGAQPSYDSRDEDRTSEKLRIYPESAVLTVDAANGKASIKKGTRYNNLIMATLIATLTVAVQPLFSALCGYMSDNCHDQGGAFLTSNKSYVAFVLINTVSIMILHLHFKKTSENMEGNNVYFLESRRTTFAMFAVIVAYLTGTYAVLAHSSGPAIVTVTSVSCILMFAFYFLSKGDDRWATRPENPKTRQSQPIGSGQVGYNMLTKKIQTREPRHTTREESRHTRGAIKSRIVKNWISYWFSSAVFCF